MSSDRELPTVSEYLETEIDAEDENDYDEAHHGTSRSPEYREAVDDKMRQPRPTDIYLDNLIGTVKSRKGRKNLSQSSSLAKKEEDIYGKNHRIKSVVKEVVTHYNKESDRVRTFRIAVAVALALLAVSIAANLGTAWYAVTANKDTSVAKTTAVPDELAVNGSNTTAVHKVLTDVDGTPIRTDRSLDKMKLTSEMDDDAWANLKEIHIKGTGGKIHFDVLGWARFNVDVSRCGTVIVVYTIAGQIQFDGTAMTFTNDVAGAFAAAGFPVSGRRKGRQSEAAKYTLTGIQEVFGAFSFVAALNTSALTCGDDKPNITNNPFTSDVDDFVLVEHQLYGCGFGQRPECPASAEISEVLGKSYYKRIKTTRAKRYGDKWAYVARTVIPEAVGFEVDGTSANVLVEASNSTHVWTYTEYAWDNRSYVEKTFEEDSMVACFWPRVLSKPANPLPYRPNDEDEGELDYVMAFVGYDVMNGEYVRHYTLTPKNQSLLDESNVTASGETMVINFFESFEKSRLYSLGFFAPEHYSTYETIDTNPDPSVLQDEFMPALPIDQAGLSTWLENVQCPGVLGVFLNELDDGTIEDETETYDEAMARSADDLDVPDLIRYVGFEPFTLKDADERRLGRQMQLATDAALDLIASANSTNTTNTTNGRHRREDIQVSVPEDLQDAILDHMEQGSDFTRDTICKSQDACWRLFGNVSASCCETVERCSACLDLLQVDRLQQDTGMTEFEDLRKAVRDNRARRGFEFALKVGCTDPWSRSASWGPFSAKLEVCTQYRHYYWTYKSYCSSACSSCTQIRIRHLRWKFFKFYYVYTYSYKQLCSNLAVGRPFAFDMSVSAKACIPRCSSYPRVYLEGKLYIEAAEGVPTPVFEAGGEIGLGVKFKILGKEIDIGMGMGFRFTLPATLQLYAYRKFGCCGGSVKIEGFLSWTPPFPQPRPPTGAGIGAEACFGIGWFKVCGSVTLSIGV